MKNNGSMNVLQNFVPFITKYIWIIFLCYLKIMNRLRNFSNTSTNIYFTFEKENNNILAFLYYDIMRNETFKTFKTSFYRQPTFTGDMGNRSISIKYKYSLISSILLRRNWKTQNYWFEKYIFLINYLFLKELYIQLLKRNSLHH